MECRVLQFFIQIGWASCNRCCEKKTEDFLFSDVFKFLMGEDYWNVSMQCDKFLLVMLVICLLLVKIDNLFLFTGQQTLCFDDR